jgi:hypothetical protein
VYNEPLLYGETESDDEFWLDEDTLLTDIYNGDFNIHSRHSESEVL